MASSIFHSIFIILVMTMFGLQSPLSLMVGTMLCGIYSLPWLISQNLSIRNSITGLALLLVLFIPSLTLNHGWTPLFYFISMIFIFLSAKRFSELPIDQITYCLRMAFIFFIILITYFLILYRESPEPLGEVVPGSSTNGIPSYLIVLQIALSLTTYIKQKKLPILSSLATLIVAFFGLGRGSIVIAGLIFGLSLIVDMRGRNTVGFALRLIIILIPVILLITLNFDSIQSALIGGTRLKEGLIDPYRLEILSQYAEKMNAFSIIFGADYAKTVINTQYAGNPHIAFIRTHAYFGLMPLILIVLSPFLFLCARKAFSYKAIAFLLVGLALMRAVSEPIFFPTLLDLFYFFYYLVFFRYAPSKSYRHGSLSS